MKRRQFLIVLGGLTAAIPFTAHAQQAIPVVGVLHSAEPTPVVETQLAAFREGLQEGGYTAGQNVAIEYRWGQNVASRMPELAAEFVRRRVNVIAAVGGPSSNIAAKNATTTIPVVFNTGADPIAMGLVTNFNRPGGNVTGVAFLAEELGGKALSLLHHLVPGARTIGLLVNPRNPEAPRRTADATAAASKLGVKMEVVEAASGSEIDKAFDVLANRKADALLVGGDAFYAGYIQQFVALAARHKLPAMFSRREFAEAGGLASYGASVRDAYRQVGIYVARVLKGERPGDLPVMQAIRFEFVLNLKTARSLGIDVPMAFSGGADEIIE